MFVIHWNILQSHQVFMGEIYPCPVGNYEILYFPLGSKYEHSKQKVTVLSFLLLILQEMSSFEDLKSFWIVLNTLDSVASEALPPKKKLTWQWKTTLFEDVFPSEHGDFPMSC